jgi:ribA/ribD-fused uncharacterized protein
MKSPKDYGYVLHKNLCLFQKGPLSQWWGAYPGQNSNFVPEGGGETYNCAEQWMMTVKAVLMGDDATAQLILNESNPANHKALGRQIKNFDSALWDKHKEKVVYLGNLWKFRQNPELKEFLLSFPRHTVFAEAAPWDPIWGIGLGPTDPDALDQSKWKGKNLLGKAIQRVHRELF